MIPPLCFITDPDAPLPLAAQALAAARGGAGWVQLRHKFLADSEFAILGEALLAELRPRGVKLIVNDRVEVARAIGADGLHLGQGDMSPITARTIIGPDAILGLSIECKAQLDALPANCLNYLGVGPIRSTATKPGHAPPIGIDGFARITARTSLPCIAIGGLDASDAATIQAAGGAGLAIVSAISRSADPECAAREIMHCWTAAKSNFH